MFAAMTRALTDTIAANVRRMREAAGLNQWQLAAKAGCHRNTVAKLETGRSDSVRCVTIEQLAAALDVSVYEILEPIETDPEVVASLFEFLGSELARSKQVTEKEAAQLRGAVWPFGPPRNLLGWLTALDYLRTTSAT